MHSTLNGYLKATPMPLQMVPTTCENDNHKKYCVNTHKQFIGISMQKKYLPLVILVITLTILAVLGFLGKPYIEPYYNAQFTHYGYQYPAADQDFVIRLEPSDITVPAFILNTLKLAFYDRQVIISADKKPNLIIRSEHIKTSAANTIEYLQWNAPYVSYSMERWSLPTKKYRKNAPPLAEFVSTLPKKNRELYFPFMAWCNLQPKRLYNHNHDRTKFLAYIASNCVQEREKLFAIIKERRTDAEALGMCSNPQKTRYPADWGGLDQAYSHYNFAFAMENHQVPGYITEKIITAFRGGAIPIYWGDSATVKKYFNPKAFVDVSSFKNLEEAAKYIVQLSYDPKAMERMRQEPIFIDNKIPDLFSINVDPQHPLLKKAAAFIRAEYFKALSQDI